ncbi:GNAT family N-acetyltransferase [Heliomarina baculiformis]|uniref:GNAT family N-acetyltransferase n=1 Tax=Heliomarina baculiformis TaxID=2872036 RepID=UPI001EE189DE|nr:GNAT family N-acetyltransferase [Heliomarina baculiformis]
MQISFGPIGPGDYHKVAHIAVAPEQVRFSGTVEDAFASPSPTLDFYAIELDGNPVGFFKIDLDYRREHDFALPGELGLRTVMLETAQQGKGVASQSLRALPAFLKKHYPEATSLALTVNTANAGAIRCYISSGFSDTGELYLGGDQGPQHVMRLALT